MENKKITIPVIIILVIAVISLGIAFATFSTVLNINGSADVAATSWDIYFTSGPNGSKPTSSVTVPIENISTSGSALNHDASFVATSFTWDAYFQMPNDRIVYTIYVKNGGSYNARVSSINMPSITCTNDSKNACDHLNYGLYTDTAGQNELTTSFTVNAGQTEVFYLIAWLDTTYGNETGSGLVSTDVVTNSITATVTFEQASSAVTNNTNSGNSGGNELTSGDYLVPEYTYKNPYYDEESGDEEEFITVSEHWGEMSDIESTFGRIPSSYIKRQNDDVFICFNINSTEQCFDEDDFDDPEAVVSSSCNGVGFSSVSNVGCGNGDGTMCYGPNISIFGFHSIYDINWEYADGEPYLSKGFEIYFNDNSDYCSFSTEYSEDAGSYELHYSCYYNVETGD